ncbi:MAG TPA: type II toxin-antitoxin system HicB family antitoxin [Burkholderiaceae bacterium]|jgi:antitoxin HicB|nr:type II toxin-antitoxin system HicB family antitoxin [Burkholderiaceae bacterium]
MLAYPAKFAPAKEGGFVVTFRDIPEAITQGESVENAQARATDALITALDFYFEDRREVPAPSRTRRGERLVELPASVSAKVLLLNEMVRQHVRPIDLARRMKVTPQEVNRLTDIRHRTRIDGIEQALRVLGKHLTVGVV